MKTIFLLTLLACSYTAAQDNSALVTFYSGGCKMPCWKEMRPPMVVSTVEMFYVGTVYDGSTQLAHLTHNQFLTFRLPAGPHVFAEYDIARKPKQPMLNAVLEPGKHYYVRMASVLKQAIVYAQAKTTLDLVDCSVAAAESANLRVVGPNKLKVKKLDQLVMTQGFPSCEP